MRLRLFLIAAIALLQVAPSWSASIDGVYTAVGHGTDSCSTYVAARSDPPALEPPSAPEPTTVQQALWLMSQLGMGVGVNPSASMSMVPGVQDYVDSKNKEVFDEASKNYSNQLKAALDQQQLYRFMYEDWLGGYLTAYNRKTDEITNILEGTDIAGAMLWLENYCRMHPTESFADAAFALVTDRLGALAGTDANMLAREESKTVRSPLPAQAATPETVDVKYRGPVSLTPFKCDTISRSSFIQRVCYDTKNAYMLINLSGTWYHYCEIDPATVTGLLTAESMGRFYNVSIKGNFDCRTHRFPAY
jgi:hypothetical protein